MKERIRRPRRARRAGAAAAPEERPALPLIPGGKALARLNFFLQQRMEETAEVEAAAAAPFALARRPVGRARRAAPVAAEYHYLEATEARAALAAAVPAQPTAVQWRPLGPVSIPHGQTYGEGPGSRPSVSGRISAVAVDPNDPQHVLIGAAGGGVWESRDEGRQWTPRTDNQPSLATGALVFDPSNPAVVYAGTGEGDSTFVDSPNLLGVGLLRSQDGGATWVVHATAPFEQVGFYDLAVDPLDGNHLLAATTVGLFEATDGGTQWTRRRTARTWDLSMRSAVTGDPTSTRELFAGCADGLFRSENGGTTWSAVTLPDAPDSFERIEVCHAPSDGNVVYVFAAGPPEIADPTDDRQTMWTPYLWRRSVAGGSFAAFEGPEDLQTGQAWYDWFAGVAPNNPDVLYVAGINVHRGIRSALGEWSWTNIAGKRVGDSIHPDQHAIAFSPADPGVVYIGNDGGIYRSPDAGVTWQSLNKGLCITEIEFLAQHPQYEAWLIAGTQDNGTMRYQGEEVWYHVADGDGGDCGCSATVPETCYHTYFGMGMERSRRGGSWESWDWIGPNVPAAQNYPSGALFYPPMELNGQLVAQAGRTVYVNSGTGFTWEPVPLPGTAGVATALALPSDTRIYAATHRGRVYRIDRTDQGWQAPVALTRPVAGWISDLLVDPTNPDRIWVTCTQLADSQATNRVFRSDDAGTTWVAAGAGIPNIALNAIAVDPLHPDTVFVAADVGVYRSTDAGANWAAFNNGLPNCLIKDLLFHAPSRLLRAGTQARGVWEIPVDPATVPDVEVYLRDSVVDTGRLSPSPSGVPDPFQTGGQAFWWQCADIKVDSPSFHAPSLDEIDFEAFEDDVSMVEGSQDFAAGLEHENPLRGRTARVYVQAHNRGSKPATNVAVKVFYAAAAMTFPDLPAGFWTDFPDNSVPADSAWQPVAAHRVVPSIDGGRSQILGFEWEVPAAAPAAVSLLALISADNDGLEATELGIEPLVRGSKKAGLKSVTVVNPSPVTGAPVRALRLDLRRTAAAERFSVGTDRAAGTLLRGLVVTKQLARAADEAGLERVALDEEEKAALARLCADDPALERALYTEAAYRAARGGPWLKSVSLATGEPQPLVALVSPRPREGYVSLLQWREDGELAGGYTLQAESPRRAAGGRS